MYDAIWSNVRPAGYTIVLHRSALGETERSERHRRGSGQRPLMAVGASCVQDCERLRCGPTAQTAAEPVAEGMPREGMYRGMSKESVGGRKCMLQHSYAVLVTLHLWQT